MAPRFGKKCPQCKKVYSVDAKDYGCPLITCAYCGKKFFDPERYEEALKPYEKMPMKTYTKSGIIMALFMGFFGFALALFFSHFNFLIALGAFVAVAIIAFLYTGRTSLEQYEKEETEKKKRWEESDKRLQDKEYATFLKEKGFLVPEKYL